MMPVEPATTPLPVRRDDDAGAVPSWLVRAGFLAWAVLVYVCYWLWLAQGTR